MAIAAKLCGTATFCTTACAVVLAAHFARHMVPAGALLVGSIGFAWLSIRLATRAYHTGARVVASVRRRMAPRTGQEIYVALFGQPATTCVRVLRQQDQVVPRLDCCIWLEFQTCPAELSSIIARDSAYHAVPYTAGNVPDYGPKPAWWTPEALGPHPLAYRKYRPGNPNRDQLLVFSADSTHAYYCDMAD